ncbi:hypothetical protein BX666DRAFT_1992042 [Dichotomocladium elegans]|nr:hypothetical protein BX666DRAFT_1992042 [Dichotomocladium elegans]
MVLLSNPREFAPLMAASSFKQKVVGGAARLLKAIPVIRPQDLATKGKGTIKASEGDTRVIGTDTVFTQQISSRDLLQIDKTLKIAVADVISDTELVLKEPVDRLISNESFKIIPHVDQHVLYEKVHSRLANSGCIVIFPEGGSHDQSHMLPLKAGFALMALGAMAEHPEIDVKIVPVGLNYFHPHRFRSRAVISYGAPISINKEWVAKYKEGGLAKREAINSLLKAGHDGLKGVTVNAPSYDTLMVIAAARRLYKPIRSHDLRLDQVVDINRRFLLGYKHFENDPRLKELVHKLQAYNNVLKYFGLRDHQIERLGIRKLHAGSLLASRLIRLLLLTTIGFPAVLLNSPIILLTSIISTQKQQKALAGSSVKIAARDVLATWKVLVVAIFAPIVYGVYSFLLFIYLCNTYYPQHSFSQILLWSIMSWMLQPFLQYIGLRLLETSVDLYKSLKPLVLALSDPDAAEQIRSMREKLSETVTDFVNENGPTALEDFDASRYEKDKKSRRRSGLFEEAPNVLQEWLKHDQSLFNFNASSTSTVASSQTNSSLSSDDDEAK